MQLTLSCNFSKTCWNIQIGSPTIYEALWESLYTSLEPLWRTEKYCIQIKSEVSFQEWF